MYLPKTIAFVAAAVALSDGIARAVIVAGPQGRNLTAPTGDLAGSGWDLEGSYGGFLGTPINSNWFITANHFGGASDRITLGDGDHFLTGVATLIPGTDLVMRQVTQPFSSYATIFNPAVDTALGSSDQLVVFGRGTDRGAAIPGNGYQWGASDAAKSWGTNTYDGKITVTPADVAAGSGFGAGAAFLVADFDNDAGPNEGTISGGDSGGGVFVKRGGEWKLVGINYGVELFRSSANGGDLAAAIYDGRGLYEQDDTGAYVYLDPATHPDPVPQSWIASYVPDTLGLIAANPISVPEPAAITMICAGAIALLRRSRG